MIKQQIYINGVPTMVLQSDLIRKVIGKDEEGINIYGDFHKYYNEDGTIDTDKEAEAMNAQLKLEADVIKKDTLGRLKVALLSDPAKVFYADTDARVDLQAAIDGAGLKGLVVTMWKLAEMYDGKRIIEVTLSEIREASALALEAKGKIVGV